MTQTEGNGHFPFPVIRRPGPSATFSPAFAGATFFSRTTFLCARFGRCFSCAGRFSSRIRLGSRNPDGTIGWQHRLKRFVLRHATSFAISRAVAEQLPGPSIQVGNPYDDKVFKNNPPEPRTKELIFVGRLVSDKGADLLLEAMALLEPRPRLTIAGDGPERASLEKQAADLQLQSRVEFRRFTNQRATGETFATTSNPGRALALAGAVWDRRLGRDCVWLRRGRLGGRWPGGSDRSLRPDVSERGRASARKCAFATARQIPPSAIVSGKTPRIIWPDSLRDMSPVFIWTQ